MTLLSRIVIFASALAIIPVAIAEEKPQFTGRTDPLQAMRALPAVYHIYMVGDGDYRVPRSVNIRLEGLDEIYRQGRAAGEISPEISASGFKWLSLAAEPSKYFTAAEVTEVLHLKESHVSMGSGFAISRDGFLLTNRHVVEDKRDKPLDEETVTGLNPACLNQMRTVLMDSIGPWDGDAGLGVLVEGRILAWLGQQCRQTVHFDRAVVAVAYAEPRAAVPDAAEMTSRLFGLPVDRREPIYVPAKVVALGGAGFPNDVAILKIEADVLDALVCLPLAKPGQAQESAKIFSLGFPGYRYDETTMSQAELSMVSVSSGMIHWVPNSKDSSLARRVKAKAKDLDEIDQQLLGVTAIIRQGSSGGPLVLANGTVVGLNVAFRNQYDPVWNCALVFGRPAPKNLFPQTTPEGAQKSLDMAVPIEVALKMLADQHIAPDPGPTTELWRDGMDLYDAGKYSEALAKFELVAAKQVLSPVIGKPYEAKRQPIRIVSHYVKEMIECCRKANK